MNLNRLTHAELHKELCRIIQGKGVQKRIADDAAMPVINVKNDGVRFDPKWQDDLVSPNFIERISGEFCRKRWCS